ncbi:MAG TPA: RidA family protein [Candidatus Lustribacter sp.]|jgi:2-iminobutanoate/2-iminopropanoate deaminase|nr:RidA family protein [Candidatus Lustribacter sp.]
MPKEILRTSAGQRHTSPIPQGVIANGFIFLSAIRGLDIETQKVIPDVEAQARQCFKILRGTLEEVGASLSDVVQVSVYMKHLQKNRPIFNKVWEEIFGDEPPARFAAEVTDIGTPDGLTEFLLSVIATAPKR